MEFYRGSNAKLSKVCKPSIGGAIASVLPFLEPAESVKERTQRAERGWIRVSLVASAIV